MKINIAASHRFHLLDLAVELEKLGHEVRFYSYVPTARAIKYGLKKECSYSMFIPMLPFLALVRLSKGAEWALRILDLVLDFYLSWFMKPCDVYIALGTVYERSLISAKRIFGAVTVLEWGSKHILEQQRILSEGPGYKRQSEFFIARALHGYEIADYIAIPSDHVRRSFIERGVSEEKLLQNAYGVSLSMFHPTELIKDQAFDLIMVGGWSYRKGCDLLVDVCRKTGFSLLHVGPIVDLEFPVGDNFRHIDAVDQGQLVKYYARAKVFVLPSREEGLAMVQPQAMVCGLPVVCSMHTGGRDLRAVLSEQKWIVEMPEYTAECLEVSIRVALELAGQQRSLRAYAGEVQKDLSWSSYGKRYDLHLRNIVDSIRKTKAR